MKYLIFQEVKRSRLMPEETAIPISGYSNFSRKVIDDGKRKYITFDVVVYL